MNNFSIDMYLRMIYKKLSHGQTDDAHKIISGIMGYIDDKKIRYSLFVAWAMLNLNDVHKAHNVIRDLHYSMTA